MIPVTRAGLLGAVLVGGSGGAEPVASSQHQTKQGRCLEARLGAECGARGGPGQRGRAGGCIDQQRDGGRGAGSHGPPPVVWPPRTRQHAAADTNTAMSTSA